MIVSPKKSPEKCKKAVIIAKDVIKQIKLGVYKPQTGCYVENFKIKPVDPGNYDLQKLIQDNTKPNLCKACALGTLFLSKVAKYDKCSVSIRNSKIDQIMRYSDPNDNYYTDHHDAFVDKGMDAHLATAFTQDEIIAIEASFEKASYIGPTTNSHYEHMNIKEVAALMYPKYNTKDRLLNICRNIIRNKGHFNLSREAYRRCIKKYG